MNISILLKIINKGILHNLFSHHCIICSEKTHRKIDLCKACEKDLPWLKRVCYSCANPLPYLTTQSICGACLKNPLPFYKLCIFFSYTDIIKRFIIGLKFQQRLDYAKILGTLLAKKINARYQGEPLPDRIIPVPLHKKRLYERGFNQAIELAKPISKKLNIPIEYRRCKRVHNTVAQSKLSASQRVINMKNAFIAHPDLAHHHIALLDDVMTTGRTLIETSRALYDVGVKRIDVWCCSRAYLA
ncbi:ComF family protein [Rickettsiella grylli]|uniref:Protein GntX n=1 Tax=Rickettsiella grylli TaxID=59196 RepID=A8PPG5_9COXI|nr:ComF family protein [Rickettsiella grylli]EDP45825.1 protein GntX [Rickettsiella grylli]